MNSDAETTYSTWPFTILVVVFFATTSYFGKFTVPPVSPEDLELLRRIETHVLEPGREALKEGRYDHAVAVFDSVADSRADNDSATTSNTLLAEALYLRSIAHRKKGDQAQGVADYERAIRLDPKVVARVGSQF